MFREIDFHKREIGMRKVWKILIWGAAGIGVIFLLLVTLALLLPRFVNMDSLGRDAARALESNYRIHSERVALSFLPYPHAVFYMPSMSVPELFTASAESITFYPKILPLFVGKFQPAKVDWRAPKVSLQLPTKDPLPDSITLRSVLSDLKDRLVQLHGSTFPTVPPMVVDVNNAALELDSGQDRRFWFKEIDLHAAVRASTIEMQIKTGKSNLWDALSFHGWADGNEWKSSGELLIKAGSPEDLIAYFFPSAGQRLGDSPVDLNLTFSTNGIDNARADFTASLQRLPLEEGTQNAVMLNGSLAGSLQIDKEHLDCTLSHFHFDYPRVSLTGRYLQEFADHRVTLDIAGRETDATSVRRAALAVERENQVVQHIFEIIREGEVPSILFSAHGTSPSDLDKTENFTIRGSIENGTILTPKVDLLVSNVRGDVVIANGILEATNLSGRTAGSATSDGTLKIGLGSGDLPFHLDLPLNADLSELPEILNRVVPNEAFKRELSELKDVKGKAQGRLILGESLDNVNVQVNTGPFHASGRHERIPDAIELEGASFSLDGSKITAHSLTGKAGRTKFSQVDFGIDWGEGDFIEFNSHVMAVIALDIFNPWIQAHESWKKALNPAPKGVVILDSLVFKGPIHDRAKWIFSAGGAFEDVFLQTKYIPGLVELKGGVFDFSKETLNLKGVNTTLADSSLIVSGELTGYLDDLHSADLAISGHLGPESNKKIAELNGFPKSLRAFSNLTLNSSRFVWDKEGKTAFEGDIVLPAGPNINISLLRTPEELSIGNLAIKDADSDATISLNLKEREFDLDFSGSLSNKTADKLLTENKLLTGPIQGAFKSRFYLDNPRKSTAEGQLRIAGFQFPANLRVPARIETATIEAAGNRINVKNAMISWDGSRISLGGAITIAEDAYIVDMNAFADSLDLEEVLKEKSEDRPESSPPDEVKANGRPKKAWDTPIRGIINVRSERLTYGKLIWNPANAEVSLSPGFVDVKINQANLCGISTSGNVDITPDGTKWVTTSEARDQDLESTLACVFNKPHLITGKFSLNGNITAGGGNHDLARTLDGEVDFKAKDGRLYRFQTFAKIISALSITEIYRGQLPDLFEEGCAYHTIHAKGKIKNGKLTLSDSMIDGPCVKMIFRGEIDLAEKKMDVVAMVAPLRTVDRIIGMVPLVGRILDGALFSVPVRVVGDISDPAVIPMSPTAVGGELLGIMKRTFQLPFTLIQPLTENSAEAAQKPAGNP
jgi:hypothetical protein